MLARKCDRCGNLYEPRNIEIRGNRTNGIVLIERDFSNMNSYRLYLDLCPHCLCSLNVWLKMKEGEHSEANS